MPRCLPQPSLGLAYCVLHTRLAFILGLLSDFLSIYHLCSSQVSGCVFDLPSPSTLHYGRNECALVNFICVTRYINIKLDYAG